MDLNKLLHHHQRALIDGGAGASPEAQRWAGFSAVYYAEQIARVRSALGRDDPFTVANPWTGPATGALGGMAICG